jgi:hypothetical protein
VRRKDLNNSKTEVILTEKIEEKDCANEENVVHEDTTLNIHFF